MKKGGFHEPSFFSADNSIRFFDANGGFIMADGSIKTITLENAKIQVSDNGRISTYALCKLDYIELGRTLNR